MAEDPRTPGPDSPTHVPRGLIEALARSGDERICAYEVARGRQRAVERAYDDGAVVDEIASRLLVLSSHG